VLVPSHITTQWLLKHGANKVLVNKTEHTPLQLAIDAECWRACVVVCDGMYLITYRICRIKAYYIITIRKQQYLCSIPYSDNNEIRMNIKSTYHILSYYMLSDRHIIQSMSVSYHTSYLPQYIILYHHNTQTAISLLYTIQ